MLSITSRTNGERMIDYFKWFDECMELMRVVGNDKLVHFRKPFWFNNFGERTVEEAVDAYLVQYSN